MTDQLACRIRLAVTVIFFVTPIWAASSLLADVWHWRSGFIQGSIVWWPTSFTGRRIWRLFDVRRVEG